MGQPVSSRVPGKVEVLFLNDQLNYQDIFLIFSNNLVRQLKFVELHITIKCCHPMESEIEVIVKNVSKHISLTPSELDFYTSLFEIKKLKKKEFLFRSGLVCKHEYFVSKGCLRTFTVDKDSVEHTAMFAIEDWFTGDIYSFLTGLPSRNNIMAIEESEVLLLSKKNWEKLLEQVPKFEKLYRIKFQNSFIALEQRMMLSLSESAEERYLHFIEKYPMFEKRIPQKYIASYLGITPEFLSVIRRKIAKK